MAQLLKLPERLSVIAGFIKKGASVIDVGTDHGYLPVYLAQNNLAKHIMASDISANSLKTARQTASKYGVSERIEFIEAPGLGGIYEEDVDTIVIAGLGGETIVSILSDAPWIKRCKTSLILQPQSKLEELCGFLRTSKYHLHDAEIVLDKGKHYTILLAGAAEKTKEFFTDYSPEIELYSILARKRAPQFKSFLDSLILKNQSATMSLKSSNPKKYGIMHAKLEELRNLRKAYDVWQT
jgi:tRNA (adenine22-N1)-methyltransferase